jgi:hypothetical protein
MEPRNDNLQRAGWNHCVGGDPGIGDVAGPGAGLGRVWGKRGGGSGSQPGMRRLPSCAAGDLTRISYLYGVSVWQIARQTVFTTQA